MLRFIFTLLLVLSFLVSFDYTAIAEVDGFWRRPAENVPIEPLELRSPDKETFVNPNNDWIPGAVLSLGQQGGNDLGLFDAYPYLFGGQSVVPVTPIDTGTNRQFGIDGLVGTADGYNLLSLCHNGNPKVIRFDGDTLVDIKLVSDEQCNETRITSVPGQPNWAYSSFYNASITTIRTFYTVDGGDTWAPFYDITGNFGGVPLGGINGGVIHDITGINTAFFNDPVVRQGFCANYTESDGPDNLNYVAKCVQMDVNNNPQAFLTQIIDNGHRFNIPAESAAKLGPSGDIGIMNFRNFQSRAEVDFAEVVDLGTNQPFIKTDFDLNSGFVSNDKVITGDLLPFDINDPAEQDLVAYILGWNDQERLVKGDIVRTPNIRNNPCGESTDGIVTPISYGGTFVLNGQGYKTIKTCSGSLLLTELLSTARNVPTLNEWGLIALSGLILLFGALVLRRRAQALNN